MQSDGFVVDEGTAFYGRTFEEYRRLFGLSCEDLRGRRMLDCPGGPGSFTAVAAQIGDSAVAVDPVYGPSVDELEAHCAGTIDEVVEQITEKRSFFDWSFYGDVATRERYARAAARRFLADYARCPDRYVEAALPDLPFRDDAFGLTCSANLLFLYDDRFDRDFHEAAARELARVTAGELRISGLQTLDADRSRFVEPVIGSLAPAGYTIERQAVEYRFQPGPTEVLVVTDLQDLDG
ncbi:hypothetical protein L593_00890 [Salinarchaeum sp. Harcht-Bsk1]|uniref:hypothetical protein n=1 Tax=Salinarchaeum sp. Harcht-Bsk1 TaxID=1333523 RepID=UPI000342420B|nr:hypothetical protein [Salinarchaeum sp. Harcht-Bsk1]AGN00133.1 hypothetical protein L593_00890 [Salinarchaeum sp. Harcht-Bsk1]